MRFSHVLAEPDLRPAFLMLGPGDMLGTEHLSRQPDMCNNIMQCYRCDMRWSGLLPWRSDMSRNRDVRHEHLPRRRNV